MAIRLDESVGVLRGAHLGALLPAELRAAPDAEVLLVESVALAGCFTSVAVAREFAREVSWRWQLPALAEDLACVVSELVANALDHGLGLDADDRPPSPQDGPTGEDGRGRSRPIELQLLRTTTRLICLVTDPATQPPRRQRPDAVQESGRGLQLIDSLSLSWGWVPLGPAGTGKLVWAALAAPVAEGAVGRTTG